MTRTPFETDLQGERVSLLPERAMFWPRAATLFIADVHLGKAATFRAAAIPIPGGTTDDDLARLDRIVTQTRAQRLVLLGDLIHAKAGRTPASLAQFLIWREQHSALEILLVRGNHDLRAGDPPADWRIRCVDAPYVEAPFTLRHEPDESATGYTLAGHLHPGALLMGAGRQVLKLPCFWFGTKVGVLPAFGGFTGTAPIRARHGDCVYVIADDQVIRV